MSRQVILISNLPLSAFGGSAEKVAEMAQQEYVALTSSDEPGTLILGANREHDTAAKIREYFQTHDEALPPDMPFGLLSMLVGKPHLPPEATEGALKEVVLEL